MTGPDGWPEAAVAFLEAHLPWDEHHGGWDHMFSSAYQMGVMALAALGHAEETEWGAVPAPDPRLPDPLPRWDDVCVAVVALARQQNRLSFHRMDGSPPPPPTLGGGFVIVRRDAPPPPAPNLAAGQGTGPALVDPPQSARRRAIGIRPPPEPGAGPTLDALGLTADGTWTAAAETVLWRRRIPEWDRDVPADPRFHAALDLAVATLPDPVRAEIDRLATITPEDLDDSERRHREAIEGLYREFGPNARIGEMPDADRLRASLAFARRGQLDWLFYRGWRFPDGWLADAERSRALGIFHDPLAEAIRRAVLTRLPAPAWARE